jgi:hypothetical protein
VIQLAETEYILIVSLHHQAADAVTQEILMRELSDFYSEHTEVHRALPSIQYSDWATWQKLSLQSTIEEKIIRAKQRLKDLPANLSLPIDFPRTETRARTAQQVPMRLSAKNVSRLETLAKTC